MVQQERINMENKSNQIFIPNAKYETICEVLKVAKEVNQLSKNDIYFTSKSYKYHGWQGTMKPTY